MGYRTILESLLFLLNFCIHICLLNRQISTSYNVDFIVFYHDPDKGPNLKHTVLEF